MSNVWAETCVQARAAAESLFILLFMCTQDITEFQKEKQRALNQIDVIVNLKMHQVCCKCADTSTSEWFIHDCACLVAVKLHLLPNAG